MTHPLDGMVAGNFVACLATSWCAPDGREIAIAPKLGKTYTVAGVIATVVGYQIVLSEFPDSCWEATKFRPSSLSVHLMFRRWLNGRYPIEGVEITIQGKVH